MVCCFLVCLKKTPGASQQREKLQSIITLKNTQLPTLWHGGCRGLEPPFNRLINLVKHLCLQIRRCIRAVAEAT